MSIRLALCALLIAATACSEAAPGEYGPYYPKNKHIRLSNGDTLVVYRVKYWQFRDGSPPAVQLEYEFPGSVDDTAAVRELDTRIWPALAPYAEKAELNRVILSATNLTKTGFPGFWRTSFKHYGVTVLQDTVGNWHFLDRQGVLPPAENPRSPTIFEADGTPMSMRIQPD